MSGVRFCSDQASLDEALQETWELPLRRLDGDAIVSKADFLEALAQALDFPPYFGHNWDAAAECLADLEGSGWILLFTSAGQMQAESPEDFAIALEVLEEAAKQHAQEGRRLRVLVSP